MPEKKLDLRIVKTQRSIMNAFKELLSEKSFEDITVKEICTRAETRRATFYTHYEDKYDLFNSLIKDIRESFVSSNPYVEDYEHPEEFYLHIIRCGLEFVEQNRDLVGSVDNDSMTTAILQNTIENLTMPIKNRIYQDIEAGHICNSDPETLVQFFVGGINQYIRYWNKNNKDISLEKSLSSLEEIIKKLFV